MSETRDDATVVATFLQGQVFELGVLPILGSGERSMHPVARQAAALRSGTSRTFLIPVKVASGQVMLVTQTCDLQTRRTQRGQTLAHVAPIVELDGDTLRNASRDARPNFVAIPWLGDTWFADMDQMAVVDRGVLAEAVAGPRPAEEHRRDLAYRLGRYFSRPALPDEVLEALRPLQKVADANHPATKLVLEAVAQIRVFASPSYSSPAPWSLRVTLIIDEAWAGDSEPAPFRDTGKQLPDVTVPMAELFDAAEPSSLAQLQTLWGRLCDQLRERLMKDLAQRSSGLVRDVTVGFQTSLTPRELEDSDVLDFGHYSLDV